VSISGKDEGRRIIADKLGAYGQMKMRALMLALNGVAPGAAATKTLTRVAVSTELGGARAIETNTVISRVTTAADVAEITADYLTFTTRTSQGATPKPNLDQNPLGTR
jgi:hypothetical protein